ncbi:hypothetical protein T459_20232 [Capsicum annuum]|uniref:Ubiquitin-like protease family profile domain-containing protein n=1 Tax=Capsicum annuum TaxID=4072 RepID=A0A2G2Z3W1_CAPAN|nr:hypothetical protein T459_20232 [Capsicum annuum]
MEECPSFSLGLTQLDTNPEVGFVPTVFDYEEPNFDENRCKYRNNPNKMKGIKKVAAEKSKKAIEESSRKFKKDDTERPGLPKIVGETVKSVDINSADDPMDGHYFDWNRSPIQEQSEDVKGCCEDIATARLDALVKFVVNQNPANPNIGTPSTVHINKDHMDVERVSADIGPATLESLVAVVENLKPGSANVGTSTMQVDYSSTLSESAQVELMPYWKHIDVIFYHLRKKSKLRNDQDYRFTTTNCFFKNYIVKTYSNYYEDDTDTVITTQQDYAQYVDVVLNEDAITNIIKRYCMPSGLPWHQVDEVYVPVNCNEKFHWVLAVIDLKNRRIRVYDSLSSLRNMESINEINKLAAMLPTYLSDNRFFEEISRTDWANLEAYRDKITQRTQFLN